MWVASFMFGGGLSVAIVGLVPAKPSLVVAPGISYASTDHTAIPVIILHTKPTLFNTGRAHFMAFINNKKLSYRKRTARCAISVEILSAAAQLCKNRI